MFKVRSSAKERFSQIVSRISITGATQYLDDFISRRRSISKAENTPLLIFWIQCWTPWYKMRLNNTILTAFARTLIPGIRYLADVLFCYQQASCDKTNDNLITSILLLFSDFPQHTSVDECLPFHLSLFTSPLAFSLTREEQGDKTCFVKV